MAEVPVTIVGIVAPMGKASGDQPYPAVITGKASITGLGIGGGPIMPPPGGGGEHPAHPIYLPPVISGPPGPWPTPPIYLPPDPGHPPPLLPTHPIVLPPIDIPPPDGGEEQDKWQVQTYWTPETGWGVAIVPGPGHPGVPTPSKK
jgi:hypothetical protein